MRVVVKELGFALAAWLAPFAASVFLFPLKQSWPPLFDSLMGVVLAGSTVLLGCAYLRRAEGRFAARGVRIGAMWMIANWALDAPMFSAGPMAMGLGQYVMDVGLAYLMIPVITIGLGVAAQRGATRAA